MSIIHRITNCLPSPRRPGLAAGLLLLGAAPGFAQLPLATLEGPSFWGQFGTSVASIGDVDKDGVLDFAVGRPESATNLKGTVTVYSGKTRNVLTTLTGITDAAFGASIAGAGDANQDGYPDLVVGSPDFSPLGLRLGQVRIYSGKDWTILWSAIGAESDSDFSRRVVGVGDVNKDGADDVAVSAQNADGGGATDRGSVTVFSGKDGAVLYTFYGIDAYGHFGKAIAGIGDMNGNGYPDIAIGAPDDGQAGFRAGYVTVKDGWNGGTIWSGLGSETSGALGSSVAGADVNGDGLMDLVIGAVGEANDRGRVRVIPGPWGGPALWTTEGDNPSDEFGATVAGALDVNKDGHHDVLVGAPQTYTGNGYVRALSGKDHSTLWSTMTGVESGSRFGISIAPLGDLDGDGWLEVAIGAPDQDVNGSTNVGAVRLVRLLVEQQNLGNGGPGSTKLRVYGGALSTGNNADLSIQFAPANNPVFLIASPTAGYTPYKQGTIVPSLSPSVILPLATNAAGEIHLAGIPGGYGAFSIYVQAILPAPSGFQFSNAVKVDMLP